MCVIVYTYKYLFVYTIQALFFRRFQAKYIGSRLEPGALFMNIYRFICIGTYVVDTCIYICVILYTYKYLFVYTIQDLFFRRSKRNISEAGSSQVYAYRCICST